MAFIVDTQELKPGLILFRRTDVKHHNWYCRIRLPNAERYKTISLKTAHLNEARDKAFDQDAEIRFRIKHEIPVFDKTFAEVAKEFSAFQISSGAAIGPLVGHMLYRRAPPPAHVPAPTAW